MSFIVIVECGECGRELERSGRAFATREAAQAAADQAEKVAMLWAPRCRAPGLHSGPYGDTNMNATLRVIEGEPAS